MIQARGAALYRRDPRRRLARIIELSKEIRSISLSRFITRITYKDDEHPDNELG